MTQEAILWPVIALVALTSGVWVFMYTTRLRYIAAQRIDPETLKDRLGAAERLRGVSAPASNLANLFETPLLFYLVAVLLLVLEQVDPLYVRLAWVYVVLRVLHSMVHVTYNRVVHRFALYAGSCIVLGVLWARFAIELLGSHAIAD